MRDFRGLKVWRKAHELTLAVYKATRPFPKDEMYGLTSEIRPSCESIPANIAEGCGRSSGADFARFLNIAVGSASELEYHLLLSHDLGLFEGEKFKQLEAGVVELKRRQASFVQKLNVK